MGLMTPKPIKKLEDILDNAREGFEDVEGYTAWTTRKIETTAHELLLGTREAVQAGHGRAARELLQRAESEPPVSDSGKTLWITVLYQALSLTVQAR